MDPAAAASSISTLSPLHICRTLALNSKLCLKRSQTSSCRRPHAQVQRCAQQHRGGQMGGFRNPNAIPQRRLLVLPSQASRRWWQEPSRDDSQHPDHYYSPFPWEDQGIGSKTKTAWVHDDVITFITADGFVQMGGNMRRLPIQETEGRMRWNPARFNEATYMDPDQGLCLAALFTIQAFNSLDCGRRFCVQGFCRSAQMLNDVVEDTVAQQGGEIINSSHLIGEGLHEKLKLTVSLPLLWGVPPALDPLNHAIRCGGGIVEKTFQQWEFI